GGDRGCRQRDGRWPRKAAGHQPGRGGGGERDGARLRLPRGALIGGGAGAGDEGGPDHDGGWRDGGGVVIDGSDRGWYEPRVAQAPRRLIARVDPRIGAVLSDLRPLAYTGGADPEEDQPG